MAFRPVAHEAGRVRRMLAANTTAFVKGDALAFSSGLVTPASGGQGTDVKYISLETKTTGTGDYVLCYKVDETVLVNADCDAAPTQAQVGTVCDLASDTQLDTDASADDLFFIESIDLSGGAVGTSTKVYGYFTNGAPNA